MSTNKCEIGVGCNLENEFNPDDEYLLKKLNLTKEQIELKEKDLDAFWKSVANTLRTDLSDLLDDNKEVIKFENLNLKILNIFFLMTVAQTKRVDGRRESRFGKRKFKID